MPIQEAKRYVGKHCRVSWTDRKGASHSAELTVEDVQFVPLYGFYIIGNSTEVRLDKVVEICELS